MKLVHFDEIPLEKVTQEGAENIKIRWLLSKKDNVPNFFLRMFEVQPGGHTPYHTHDWEHEVFVLEGDGILKIKTGEQEFHAWDVIYVDPNMYHQFKNTGTSILRFLCIIPSNT